MIVYQLRHALRRLWRDPAFTLAGALTLALGVGANVGVFAVVETVLLRPLPYPDADQLVVIRHRDQQSGVTKPFIAMGDYLDLASRQSAFRSVGAYGTWQLTIYGEEEPFQVPSLMATSALLTMLDFRPVLGRSFRAEDELEGAGPVMILGHELWRTRFGGDSAVIGRSVKLGDGEAQVIGVAPAGFRFPPDARAGVMLPLTLPTAVPAARKSGWTFAAARLAPGRTVDAATVDLAGISAQLAREYPDQNQGSTYYAASLRDEAVGDAKTALWLLLAAVGTVLLIACVNVANLLVGRALSRQREMAVRMTLGASRGRLIGQLLMESLALAGVAGAIGALAAPLAVRAVTALLPASLLGPGLAQVAVNGPVLAFTLGVTLLTALACGAVAAATTPVAQAASGLVVAGRASVGPRARRAASALVAVEMALAVALLIGAGLVLKSFSGLLAVDPGFDPSRVLTMTIGLPAERYRAVEAREGFYRTGFAAVRAVPGVSEVGVGVVVPLTGNNWTVGFDKADDPVPAGQRAPEVGWQVASRGFFTALGIPLLSGRLFDDGDRPDGPPVVIVSRAVERQFYPGGSALGQRIRVGRSQTAEIVGVVGDIRRAGLTDSPRADLYFSAEQQPSTQTTLFVSTRGEPASAIASVRSALRSVEPQLSVVESGTMAETAAESIRVTRLLLRLLGAFAIIALGLAAVGTYAVMSHAVAQRTREIGTRLALGAKRRDVLLLVLRQGVLLAGLGTVIGVAVGLAGARALRSTLFGVTAGDPGVLIGAAGILMLAAVAACLLPASRAAAVDPARTLADQ